MSPVTGLASPTVSLVDPPSMAIWRRRYGVELSRWLPGNRTLLFVVTLILSLVPLSPPSPAPAGGN